MRTQLSKLTALALVAAVAVLFAQLTDPAAAAERNAKKLAKEYRKEIDRLLPLMSAEDVGSRYEHQIAFQDLGSNASRPGAEIERQTLSMVLVEYLEKAEMPDTVRNWFVLQLQRIGGAEVVPALAKLLKTDDNNLRDFARRALEKNPDPTATDALLSELASATDAKWKIGLINALGERRAEAAVAPLAGALADANANVAKAAAVALATIRTEESMQALFSVFNMESEALKMKAAQAVIDTAREIDRGGDRETATKIYAALYKGATDYARDPNTGNPFNIRAAALNGLAVTAPDAAAPLIVAAFGDSDSKVRAAAIQAARQTPSMTPARELTQRLPELDPVGQKQVLGLIADRGDASAVDVVKKVLVGDDESVHLAAIETLTALGGGDAAETLLEVALNGKGGAPKAARTGLTKITGPGVDDLIAANAAKGEPKSRALTIEFLGERRTPGAREKLLAYAAESNEDVCSAAFWALSHVVGPNDVPTIANLLAAKKGAAHLKDAAIALKAAAAKTKDKDASARAVSDRLETADKDAKPALLNALAALGGPTALKTVAAAAKSADADLADAGVRALANWSDYEAAETLIGVASQPKASTTHHVLALTGAIRLIKDSAKAPLEDRTTLCLLALDKAQRIDEKKKAIAALGFLPGDRALERLEALVKDDKVRVEAGMALVEQARNLLDKDKKAAKELAKKVREMDISKQVNQSADRVAQGKK